MSRADGCIGVFDSGVGGISVLRQLMKLMPNERYLYYGDSINAPYGVRPSEEVCALTLKAAEHLRTRELKALVIACNTATAASIDALRETHKDLIVEGIEPALALAAEKFPGGHVAVMATPGTIKSAKFAALHARYKEACKVTLLPAPGLADLVEANKQDTPEGEALLRPLLEPLAGNLDALILGCTHYPFAEKTIRKILGPETALLDGGELTARRTMSRLEEAGLLWDGEGCLIVENSKPGEEMIALSRQLAGVE